MFLCIFPSDSTEGTVFFAPSVSSVVSRRPCRSSDLLPRLAVVGVALLAILTDRQQPENKKNTLIMQDPAEGVEPSQRAVPGAGWSVLVSELVVLAVLLLGVA